MRELSSLLGAVADLTAAADDDNTAAVTVQ